MVINLNLLKTLDYKMVGKLLKKLNRLELINLNNQLINEHNKLTSNLNDYNDKCGTYNKKDQLGFTQKITYKLNKINSAEFNKIMGFVKKNEVLQTIIYEILLTK